MDDKALLVKELRELANIFEQGVDNPDFQRYCQAKRHLIGNLKWATELFLKDE